uniref:Uncharacterized protein n=1 Tax=Cannabis sativa TaxID=3483 RepID=A0A803NM30_CANSA
MVRWMVTWRNTLKDPMRSANVNGGCNVSSTIGPKGCGLIENMESRVNHLAIIFKGAFGVNDKLAHRQSQPNGKVKGKNLVRDRPRPHVVNGLEYSTIVKKRRIEEVEAPSKELGFPFGSTCKVQEKKPCVGKGEEKKGLEDTWNPPKANEANAIEEKICLIARGST